MRRAVVTIAMLLAFFGCFVAARPAFASRIEPVPHTDYLTSNEPFEQGASATLGFEAWSDYGTNRVNVQVYDPSMRRVIDTSVSLNYGGPIYHGYLGLDTSNLPVGTYTIRMTAQYQVLGIWIDTPIEPTWSTFDIVPHGSLPHRSFPDVPYRSWYFDAVELVSAKGIIQGYSNTGLFGPLDVLTRAQAVTIFWRYFTGEDSSGFSTMNETGKYDVEDNQWYTVPVNWAFGNEIVHGIGGTNLFGTHTSITRQDLCVMLYNAAKKFSGVRYSGEGDSLAQGMPDYGDVGPWAQEAVSWALHAGVISGSIRNGQRYIDPNNDVDRATMSVIMYNIVTKDIL